MLLQWVKHAVHEAVRNWPRACTYSTARRYSHKPLTHQTPPSHHNAPPIVALTPTSTCRPPWQATQAAKGTSKLEQNLTHTIFYFSFAIFHYSIPNSSSVTAPVHRHTVQQLQHLLLVGGTLTFRTGIIPPSLLHNLIRI